VLFNSRAVQLMTKCLPVLYYAHEGCLFSKSQVKALDYALFSSFSKIFRTKSKDVVDECMLLFGCSSVLIVVNKRKAKFLDDYLKYYNNLCKLFAYIAENEKRGIKMIL